jgi:YVTN family beta-propeller protein
VIDVKTRRELRRVDLGDLRRPHGLTFTSGRLYFTAEASRRIGRYDPIAQRVDWTLTTDQEGTHMILAARDGTKLFTSNIAANAVGVFERGPNDWTQKLVAVGAGPEGLDQSPDGRELWSAHSRDGGISIIEVASGKVVHTLDAKTRRSNRLKFSPNGALVLVSDLGGGELVVIDAGKRAEKTRLQLGLAPTGILIPPEGSHAYVALSGENKIAVIDMNTLSVATTIATGGSPDGMAWVR